MPLLMGPMQGTTILCNLLGYYPLTIPMCQAAHAKAPIGMEHSQYHIYMLVLHRRRDPFPEAVACSQTQ